MSKRPYPAIPEPTNDLNSLRLAVLALKENVEILTGQRGKNDENIAVRWKDLVDQGLITPPYTRKD